MEDKGDGTGEGSIYKSQHIALKNLMNYINNSSFINKTTWYLKKVIINNAPKIQTILKGNYNNNAITNNANDKAVSTKSD
jgi:hypothetical protein